MVTLVLLGLLLPPGATPAVRAPITVQLHSASENKTTERFASAVIKEFNRDARFTRAGQGVPPAVSVTLPNQVGWERSLEWTRISYQARIDGAGRASRIIHGSCWNWNLRICAQQITNAAAEP